MAKYQITGPDGGVYEVEAPDTASEQDVLAYVQGQVGGQSPAQPKAPSSSEIKAKQEVQDLQGQHPVPDWLRRILPGDAMGARSIPILGPFLDEASAGIQGAVHSATGLGRSYEDALAYNRQLDKTAHEVAPVASTAKDLTTGLVTGASMLPVAPAATLTGRVAQGAGLGGGLGYITGFGEAEGGNAETLLGELYNRNRAALQGAQSGAALGAAIPVGFAGASWGAQKLHDLVSPQIARYGTMLDQNLQRVGLRAPERAPRSGGAAAVSNEPPAGYTPAEQGAIQITANTLARAGVTPAEITRRRANINESMRLGSNSRALNVTAPADIDPSLARVAGAAGRQDEEAANRIRDFAFARQTGRTPGNVEPGVVADEFGLPTRSAFSPPLTGREATRRLGRDFGVADDRDVPMGQFERVRDALKRALGIADDDAHGFQKTGYQTEKAIIQGAREEAKDLYSTAYKASEGVNLRPTVEKVANDIEASLIDEPQQIADKVSRMIKQFMRATESGGNKSHLERFDKVKQYWDGEIEKAFTGSDSRNKALGAALTEAKNRFLAAIDDTPVGPAYKSARNAYSSRMESRDAYRRGLEAWRDDAEVGKDAYLELTSGEQKLFRKGLLEGFSLKGGRSDYGTDVTRMFNNPRVNELLEEVIPRTENAAGKAKGAFGNRPERFGGVLDTERRFIQTRNIATGGSPTAEKLAADNAYNKLGQMFETLRNSPSLTGVALKSVEATFNRFFGFRADTSRALARQLFNADPVEQDRFWAAVADKLGPGRAEYIARFMREHLQNATNAGVVTGTAAQSRERQ
ncbi:MAG: hypothetical protein AB7O13_24770 [Alphaproteobacteria bacterium]